MRQLTLGFLGSAALFAVACGGKVVVEAGGSGGSGGGDITTTGVVTSTGVVTPTVTTGGSSLCEQFCSFFENKGCGESGCVNDCQQSYAAAGMCAPLLDQVLFCVLNSPDVDCNNPIECEGPIQDYTNCLTPGECGTDDCSGSNDGSCSCNGTCNGSLLQVQCSPGNATDFCTCFKDGTPIGKCTQPQMSGTSCDILNGCCSAVFFP